MLLEVILFKVGLVIDDIIVVIICCMYDIGIFLDWWKLELMILYGGWLNVCNVIMDNDFNIWGIVVLGFDVLEDELLVSFV